MIIRPAVADEAEALTNLAHRAKSHWGYPAALIAAWRPALTISREDIERHEVALASDSDAIAGFYVIEAPAVAEALWSLSHFWIDPPWHGRGVGRRLFEHAARAVSEAGGAGLLIESDPHAAGFYQRLGARVVGSVPAPVAGEPARRLPVLSHTPPDH